MNDVFVGGGYFELVHFNGAVWRSYKDAIPSVDGAWASIAFHGNLVIAVGLAGQQAVGIIGRRTL